MIKHVKDGKLSDVTLFKICLISDIDLVVPNRIVISLAEIWLLFLSEKNPQKKTQEKKPPILLHTKPDFPGSSVRKWLYFLSHFRKTNSSLTI